MSEFCAPLKPRLRARGRRFGRGGVPAIAFCLLLVAGCTTAHRAPPAAPVTSSPVAAPAPAPTPSGMPARLAPAMPPAAEMPTAPPTVPGPAAPAAAGLTMLVDSVPPGAIIVVDGRPVGKAPVRLTVPETAQGFFRDYMEIRARFVAADPSGDSHTVMEEVTPREKVPAVLRFTPDGAQRTAR
ncbi:MAG TPA: PEGA domain-containing protein [Opitutaceae bacterium]|nr:PEGA domain-containing protein [Opitutaceae bacterium]